MSSRNSVQCLIGRRHGLVSNRWKNWTRNHLNVYITENIKNQTNANFASNKRALTPYSCLCLQGAKSIETLEILPNPPECRDQRKNPWPEWPIIMRTEYGQEEVRIHYGHDPRAFNALTKRFLPSPDDPTKLGGLRTVSVRWEDPKKEGDRPTFVELPGKSINLFYLVIFHSTVTKKERDD